jgi:hypothetical protein
LASGKDLSEKWAADVYVGAGMQSRAETYIRGAAIKINLFDLVLKR